VVGQLDVAHSAMTASRGAVIGLALLSMAHVGSPDTFFVGEAGPYRVRVSVRLPGVIPGRAQVNVRVAGATGDGVATSADAFRVSVRAGQWNLGLTGAPPPEVAAPVRGDPALYSAELWLMTATSYELFVAVDGPSGAGTCVVPVLALATAQRTMNRPMVVVLGALGVFLSLGMLTIIGCAVRESVLPPGIEPDARRRRRARLAVAAALCLVVLALWGGNAWWAAEASSYGESVLYRPFGAQTTIAEIGDRRVLTLSIRDPRWTGNPSPVARYNALIADHGKLMHLFAVREPSMDAFAHLHPVARTPAALDFDVDLPPLTAGRYRVYGDIVHESGYAQTLVSSTEIQPGRSRDGAADPDDSWFEGAPAPDAVSPVFAFPDGSTVMWARGDHPLVEREERLLSFSARDAAGAPLSVEPYMGMAAHVMIAHLDGSVFAHLHPNGTISMAALQRFTRGEAIQAASHAGHSAASGLDVSIPYAFPKSGRYRIWAQMKRDGRIMTAAFDADVLPSR
jgi:hypothetical protein